MHRPRRDQILQARCQRKNQARGLRGVVRNTKRGPAMSTAIDPQNPNNRKPILPKPTAADVMPALFPVVGPGSLIELRYLRNGKANSKWFDDYDEFLEAAKKA